jgi:hypothetical protein
MNSSAYKEETVNMLRRQNIAALSHVIADLAARGGLTA